MGLWENIGHNFIKQIRFIYSNMSTVNKQEYIKYYRIAQEYVNDSSVLPNLTDDEIYNNISPENWLMFVKATHEDKKNAINCPEPNIFLVIEPEKLRIGLIFNNAPAMDKLKNILSDVSKVDREKLISKLMLLDDRFKTKVRRKIRKMHGPAPEYVDELIIQTNKLNEEQFTKIIEKCIQIREEGKENKKFAKYKSYYEGSAVDLTYIEISKKEDIFKKVIKDMIPLFKICVDIKTTNEIEDLELLKKIQTINQWDWYIEEDRKGLAEIIKEKFDIEVSTHKLKNLFKKLKKMKNKM